MLPSRRHTAAPFVASNAVQAGIANHPLAKLLSLLVGLPCRVSTAALLALAAFASSSDRRTPRRPELRFPEFE